jgi:hypothetical protein
MANASSETSLDLQTAAAAAPAARLRLVQTTAGGGMLDALSRALGDPGGPPDVISLSYGGCLVAENEAAPAYLATTDSVLAMTALSGVSSFVTAVAGTRLTLGPANTRTSETVWNDAAHGEEAAGGGAVGRRTPRPDFRNGANAEVRVTVPPPWTRPPIRLGRSCWIVTPLAAKWPRSADSNRARWRLEVVGADNPPAARRAGREGGCADAGRDTTASDRFVLEPPGCARDLRYAHDV